MEIRISSLNINGFRSKYKHELVKQFIDRHKLDILLLQETFIDNNYLARTIERTLELDN